MANLNPKRTKRYNQSSLARTLKGTTPRHRPSVKQKIANLNPKRTKRYSQSSLARTPPDTVLLLALNPKGAYSAPKPWPT